MINKVLLVLVLFMFFSCATIRLDKTYKLEVKSDVASSIKFEDSIYVLPTNIEVYRSERPLKLTYIVDTTKTKVSVKPILHPNYNYGNLITISGYLFDHLSEKRFYYGKTLILNPNIPAKLIEEPLFKSLKEYGNDFVNQFSKSYSTEKGDVHFNFSIPTACNFYMQPIGQGIKKSVGFGVAIGLDYCYKKNKYLSFELAGFVDHFRLFGKSYEDDDDYIFERQSATHYSLTDNFKLKRFSIGYGIAYSENNWYQENVKQIDDYDVIASKIRYNRNLGFVFNGYFHIFKHFLVGVHYRPSILEVAPSTEFSYQHIFGVDYQFKF